MEKKNVNIKRLLFNFFSLPLFSIVAVLLCFSFVWISNITSKPRSTDLDYSGIGDALFVLYVGGFLLALIVIWWHYWMISEIYESWGNKEMRYGNAAILVFPYFTALCILMFTQVSATVLNNKIDAEVKESTIAEIDRSGVTNDLITYVHKGDSTYIVTGTTQNMWPKDTVKFLNIIRIFTGGLTQNNYGRFCYTCQTIHAKSLEFLSCDNNLKSLDSLPHAFDSIYTNRTFGAFLHTININYTPRFDMTNQDYAVIQRDSIPYFINSSFEERTSFISNAHYKTMTYYQPLIGFLQHDFSNWVIYYDTKDKSVYAVVAPQYDGKKAKESEQFLYLARFNNKSVVYKVKFDWSQITQFERFVGGFKCGDEFWLLTRKKIYKIRLS